MVAARQDSPRARPDALSVEDFGRELKYGIGAERISAIENPLGAAVVQIEAHPRHLQSLLLARILSALSCGVGQFRRAEVFGLDRATRALAAALVEARAAGTVPEEMWVSAVDAAGAAQLGLQAATAVTGTDGGEA